MHQIGLYYPYFHIRDDAWLKAAALYLPQVARVRPPRYPVNDSPTAAALRDELDFLLDVDPGHQALVVAQEFEALVDQEEEFLRDRYRIPPAPSEIGAFGTEVHNPWLLDENRFAWIHTSQLGAPTSFDYREWTQILERRDVEAARAIGHWNPPTPFLDRLHDLQLIRRTRFDPVTGVRDDLQWIGMHPHLVSIYSCALANRIAQANALTPVTDDPQAFSLPGRGTAQELGAALLHPALREQANGQAAALYACAAVRVVVPANINQVPVERIIRARRVLSEEFEAFRTHIDGLSEEFALLEGIEDPGILGARLNSMVERDMAKPTQDLKRGLRTLGLEPARAVFALKTLELPAIAALAAHTLHLSPIAGAGGAIAAQLVASARTAHREAAVQRTSAAGYLLGLRRELEPAGLLTRVRRAFRGHQ